MSVSIVVPSHADLELLARSLRAVLDQEPAPTELVVVDTDPRGDVATWVTEQGLDTRVSVVAAPGAGFARAANAGIRPTSGEIVLVLNSDVFLSPGFVRELVSLFDRRPRAGCAGGKLLREGSSTIDTAGLAIGRNRRAVDRGEGEPDAGQFDHEEQTFGISAAAIALRRAALEDVALGGEYFDETFFMYKEDVDLCWRLRLAGWECWYVPVAVGYHARTSRGLGARPYRSAIRAFHENERRKPRHVRLHSMKNQWLVLLKNEDGSNFARDFPHILGREVLVLVYNTVFAPRLAVDAISRFASAVRPTLRRRGDVCALRVVAPRTMRRWFDGPGRR